LNRHTVSTSTTVLGWLFQILTIRAHGSETWPVRKENEVALQLAEMRMVRWMCNVKMKNKVPSKEFRERLGIDDIILILQQKRLRCYRHVL